MLGKMKKILEMLYLWWWKECKGRRKKNVSCKSLQLTFSFAKIFKVPSYTPKQLDPQFM